MRIPDAHRIGDWGDPPNPDIYNSRAGEEERQKQEIEAKFQGSLLQVQELLAKTQPAIVREYYGAINNGLYPSSYCRKTELETKTVTFCEYEDAQGPWKRKQL